MHCSRVANRPPRAQVVCLEICVVAIYLGCWVQSNSGLSLVQIHNNFAVVYTDWTQITWPPKERRLFWSFHGTEYYGQSMLRPCCTCKFHWSRILLSRWLSNNKWCNYWRTIYLMQDAQQNLKDTCPGPRWLHSGYQQFLSRLWLAIPWGLSLVFESVTDRYSRLVTRREMPVQLHAWSLCTCKIIYSMITDTCISDQIAWRNFTQLPTSKSSDGVFCKAITFNVAKAESIDSILDSPR